MCIVQFSATSQKQRDQIQLDTVKRTGSIHDIDIVIVSPAKLYMTDLMIRKYLCMENESFLRYKHFFDNDGGSNEANQHLAAQAKQYLDQAAINICLTLGPVTGVIINESSLRADEATMYFMDRPIGSVRQIARHRSTVLLQQLAARNPDLVVHIIKDNGEIVEEPIERVIGALQV
jgi:hypothetical protein